MQIKSEHLEQLELEIQHIFDSGANEVRVYEMIQTFIERRGKALFIPDVGGSLPNKEEIVSKCYNKVLKNDFKFRKVFKDIVDDAYYSGALDMHEELTK